MSGKEKSSHVSVRVRSDHARQLDALAESAGLCRSELLRLAICRFVEDGLPQGLLAVAADLRRARAAAE